MADSDGRDDLGSADPSWSGKGIHASSSPDFGTDFTLDLSSKPWEGSYKKRVPAKPFAKGNQYGKANEGKHIRARFRKYLTEARTPRDIRNVARKLRDQALEGNVSAARLWLEHVVGTPLQQIEISGPDNSDLDIGRVVTAIVIAFGNTPEVQAKVGRALEQLEDMEMDHGSDPS